MTSNEEIRFAFATRSIHAINSGRDSSSFKVGIINEDPGLQQS
jgi:hypothetical protein